MADITKIQHMNDSTQYLITTSQVSEPQLNKVNITNWINTSANIHNHETQGEMLVRRFFAAGDEANYASSYDLPCVDNHNLIFSIDSGTSWNRVLSLDMRSNDVYVRAKTGGTWGSWEKLVRNTGTWGISITGNAATATKLSNTPNNTTTFLRGDNTWSNILAGVFRVQYSTPNLYIRNTNTNKDTYSILRFGNDNRDSGAVIFLNDSARTTDGGASMFTLRNDVGDMRLDDNVYITGTIHCTAGTGNYCEGMRFERPDGQWVTIALGGTSTSGTNTNCWSIHRKSDNNFCISRNSSDGANGLVMTSTGMGLGTTSPVSRFTVNAAATDSVGAIRVIDTRTDTGWHYPVLCTSPSIANGGNVYICLGKACSTGNSAGVRWYHAADNSNDNLIGFEIWGVGTHLYCKRNTYSYATRMYGAVWNDYAEFRETKDIIEPGRCIKEVGDDTLVLTTERLEKGCEIVSDTYGFAIGESDKCKTPTAASGRVLAYLYEDRETAKQHIGDPVCSGPYGTISIMTEEEARLYPWCIIGTISSIPDYEIWHAGHNDQNNVDIPIEVNGRIWIRIR